MAKKEQRRSETIRLPTEENGQTVWRTVRERFLVGVPHLGLMTPSIGLCARDRERWGGDDWFVIQADGGKLTVYRPRTEEREARIQVFDSFESMTSVVPPEIFLAAAEFAGVRQRISIRKSHLTCELHSAIRVKAATVTIEDEDITEAAEELMTRASKKQQPER